jgi:putative tryptophan/tyrosine transport system substrate-binding protein
MFDMRRREFITLLGGAAAVWPLAARAQQPTTPVIGFLATGSPVPWAGRVRKFREGLSQTGYVEGQNIAIEYHWAEGKNDRLPTLASDLVHREVTVIAANGPAAVAAKAVTTTIPIVFFSGGDPVARGLVASLNRPGGNLTGISTLLIEVGAKRLELLHELVSTARTMALLVNPTNPTLANTLTRNMQEAARTLGLRLEVLQASTEHEVDAAFATIVQLRAGALAISPDAFFSSHSEQLAALTLRHNMPAIFDNRAFTAAGGLMSYGSSTEDAYHLMGVYTGRILKGEKPADLPVHQSTKVELIINLKTAKTLGLTIPLPLTGRADEVIE